MCKANSKKTNSRSKLACFCLFELTNGFVDKEGSMGTEEGGDSTGFGDGDGGGTGLGAGRRGCSGMSGATAESA